MYKLQVYMNGSRSFLFLANEHYMWDFTEDMLIIGIVKFGPRCMNSKIEKSCFSLFIGFGKIFYFF